MKKILLTSFITASTLFSYSSEFSIDPNLDKSKITLPGTSAQISSNEFIRLKPKDYINLTGKKLSLKEFLFFKITQRWTKKVIRKRGTVDVAPLQEKEKKPFKWHWGGFCLGLFLPIIGLLIAGIIKKDDKKWDRINSAAIATAIVSIVFIFIVLRSF